MTVPFNSAVINGGAYPVVWAEGFLEGEAQASGGADRTAYATLDSAQANVASNAIPVRRAGVGGKSSAEATVAPYHPVRITPGNPVQASGDAVAAAVPYRARLAYGVSAEAESDVSALVPTRLVRLDAEWRSWGPLNGGPLNGGHGWAAGLVATGETLSDNRLIAARIVAASGVAEGRASASSPTFVVTRHMDPRRMNTSALAFLREQDAKTIRVRQIYAGGAAISRASSRATPNAILGYGRSFSDAESSLTAADVYVRRATVPGAVKAQAQAVTSIHLIRTVRLNFLPAAEMRAAPDVTRTDVRYAYAGGTAETASSLSKAIARRLPKFDLEPILVEAETSAVPRFEPRSEATFRAAASTAVDNQRVEILHLVRVRPALTAIASMSLLPTTIRSVAGQQAQAAAGVNATPVIWDAQNATGTATSSAEAVGGNTATLFMTGQTRSEADTIAPGAQRIARMLSADAVGAGNVSMRASIYSIVAAQAEPADAMSVTRATPIRISRAELVVISSRAVIPLRSFKINAGDPAPSRRTVFLPHVIREIDVLRSDREYHVA